MFPFLKYTLKRQLKTVLREFWNRKPKDPNAAVRHSPPPDRGGESSAKSAENPIHGVEDAGNAHQTATGALIDCHGS